MEQEERLELAERKHKEQQMKNPLEPLLLKLAREFSDNQDLSDRLRDLYQAGLRVCSLHSPRVIEICSRGRS